MFNFRLFKQTPRILNITHRLHPITSPRTSHSRSLITQILIRRQSDNQFRKTSTNQIIIKKCGLISDNTRVKTVGVSSKMIYGKSGELNDSRLFARYYSNKPTDNKLGEPASNSETNKDIEGSELPSGRNPGYLYKLLHFIQERSQRLKYFLIKSYRPFNTDDFSAFFSWILAGNIALLIIGTTFFFSLLLFTMNTVFAQEFVAELVGNLITGNSPITVTFESAIVPDWRSGRIQLNNVLISKRPRSKNSFKKGNKKDHQLTKNSNNDDKVVHATNDNDEQPLDDGNYTQFDLTVDEINVRLSFSKWLSGRGIIKDCSIRGMRGIVDRTHVFWKAGDSATNYKNVKRPGDWEIEDLKIDDVLFTLAHPMGFRPFQVSIYHGEIPILRKNWVMLDLLSSTDVHGSYDGSLFTVNGIQRLDEFKDEVAIDKEVDKLTKHEEIKRDENKLSNIAKQLMNSLSTVSPSNTTSTKFTRLRIDNLKIEHLNGGVEGPFGWINKGTVDMIGDIIIPDKNLSNSSDPTLNEIVDYFTRRTRPSNNNEVTSNDDNLQDLFIMDLYLRLNNPKASIPLFTNELSYVNSALIRPIVGYINSNKTFIPIHCRVIKNLNDFDGSWTTYDSLLMDDLSIGVYESFVEYLSDEEFQKDRLKKVGFWSLQFLMQLILWSLSAV